MNRRLASLHWLQLGAVRQLHQYYQDAMTPCCPPAALRSLAWQYLGLHSLVSLPGGPVRRQGLEFVIRYLPSGSSPRSEQGPPKFLGNHHCLFAMFQRRRQDCLHQTIRCSSVALGHRKAKAPTKGLSTLNSMAFELAVYASQGGLPHHHARLASGRWSGATGRALTRKVPSKGFKAASLHLILLSQVLHGAITSTDVTVLGISDHHTVRGRPMTRPGYRPKLVSAVHAVNSQSARSAEVTNWNGNR